jgi:hypothetical protein
VDLHVLDGLVRYGNAAFLQVFSRKNFGTSFSDCM